MSITTVTLLSSLWVPFYYLGGLYYESMTESILNVGTHLIDDGYDEFIMITADPLHVESVQLIFYTL